MSHSLQCVGVTGRSSSAFDWLPLSPGLGGKLSRPLSLEYLMSVCVWGGTLQQRCSQHQAQDTHLCIHLFTSVHKFQTCCFLTCVAETFSCLRVFFTSCCHIDDMFIRCVHVCIMMDICNHHAHCTEYPNVPVDRDQDRHVAQVHPLGRYLVQLLKRLHYDR